MFIISSYRHLGSCLESMLMPPFSMTVCYIRVYYSDCAQMTIFKFFCTTTMYIIVTYIKLSTYNKLLVHLTKVAVSWQWQTAAMR